MHFIILIHSFNYFELFFVCVGTERLAQNLKDVLLSGDLYDTVIKVQGQEFRTHKLILVIRSPVFASLLRHEDTEEENDAILVEDCDLEAFKVFLVFLYSGKLENVSVENVTGLYGVADKYRVEEVKLECVKFMMSHLSVENFCEFISLALRHGEGQLLERATDYFIENVKSVIVTVTWQSFHAEYPVESNELYIKAIAHLIPD